MEIAGFVKTSFVDYPSHISCVVFTPGCNMNCWYCHNRDIIKMQKGVIDESVVFDYLKTRVGLIDAVVISGGECTLQPKLLEFVEKVKQMGFKVKIDTNGTRHDVLKQLVDNKLVDYVAMDIKAPIDKYSLVTPVDCLNDIIKNVEYIKNCGVDYEFRTTWLPNLTKENIIEILRFIKGAKTYSLQAYIRPSFIKEHKIPYHTNQDFYDMQDIGVEYVEKFYVKNLI